MPASPRALRNESPEDRVAVGVGGAPAAATRLAEIATRQEAVKAIEAFSEDS